MKKEKSCGVICFDLKEESPRVLLIRHRFGGHWAFPKGHVEKGETETETALREVHEETGATVKIYSGFREISTYSPAKGVIKDVIMFAGEITGGVLTCQPEEVGDMAILPFSEALLRLTFTADRELLQKCIETFFTK
ncbi:MAG: NUDIX domain-containing protein [Oscillospiraceae bacterium]